MADDELEQHSDYVQWLFSASRAECAVAHLAVLMQEESQILRASDQARARIVGAAERMSRFYAASNSWLFRV
jgi:hypothetical protein